MGVSPSDIALELGRPTPDEFAYNQWLMWIADARRIISYGDGSHAGLGDLTQLNQDVLDYVVRMAVVAHVRNPDDATQVDITVDQASVSKRFTTTRGRVTILPEWWGMLDPDLDDLGAFSVTPTGEPYVAAAFNVNTGYGYDPTVGSPWYPWDVNP